MGGGGRAGTVYAAYLLARGAPPERSLEIPGVEKDVSRAFLRGFAAALDGRALLPGDE